MRLNNLNIFSFLVFCGCAPAFAAPIYRQPAPASYCLDAEDIHGQVKGCRDNMAFLEAAQSCVRNFKKLKLRVATELKQNLSVATSAQNQNFQDNSSDNSEAIAAHDYLVKVGELSVREMDDYFDFVEHPEDAETEEDILADDCFTKPADAMSDLVDAHEADVDAMKVAKAIETAHFGISSKRTNILDTGAKGPDGAKDVGAKGSTGTAPKGKALRPSDISGTEKLKKKN